MAQRTSRTQAFIAKWDAASEGIAIVVGALTAWVVPAICLIASIYLIRYGAGLWIAGIISAIGAITVAGPRVISALRGDAEDGLAPGGRTQGRPDDESQGERE